MLASFGIQQVTTRKPYSKLPSEKCGHFMPDAVGLWQTARQGGMANPRFFHRKMRGVKTGASSSGAMANAVTAELTPSIDRKKRRFLGLFCRKTGVRPKLFNTLLCVFTCFWDSWLFQTVAPQGEPARGRLQNKSYLKTYRRFFVRSGMWLNKPVKVEMTGRDEGCGRRAALRAAALLSRSYAIVRGAHAPSPSQAAGARNSGAILTKASAIIPQPDCNSRRGIAPDCTKLHQIAPNCGHCAKKSKRRKTGRKKSILLLSFCLQDGGGVPPPGL